MGEIGTVISVENGYAQISITRSEACAKCGACKMGSNDQEMLINAKNDCGATIGEVVELELEDGAFFKASLIMFGVPLLMLIAGIAIGTIFMELVAFLFGVLGIVIAFLLIKKNEKILKTKEFSPYIKKICDDKIEE